MHGTDPLDADTDAGGLGDGDLWVTWCGPCVAGMPHLQEVAAHYREQGVTVVGISVDEKQTAPKRFFRGAPPVAYALAWVGRSGFDTAQVSGIPSLFVLDADKNVATYISGYGGNADTRLEEVLDTFLAR